MPKIKHFSPIEVEKIKAKIKLVPKRGIFLNIDNYIRSFK